MYHVIHLAKNCSQHLIEPLLTGLFCLLTSENKAHITRNYLTIESLHMEVIIVSDL